MLAILWRVILHRFIFSVFFKIILIPVTLYATAKDLKRLPFGLDSIAGCEEDCWNGNGEDPSNPRQGWIPGKQGIWHEDRSVNKPAGVQGWWPDYLGLDWNELSWIKKWWLGYKWCAFRNLCWNLRLRKWFSTNIHYDNIEILEYNSDYYNYKVVWKDLNGNKYFMRRKKFLGMTFEWGWEYYDYIHNKSDPRYGRIRKHGYTKEYKYKIYSIPSFRKR